MAKCPKCGEGLRWYHWRPECPFCGVNMLYYDANGRLLAETEKAEIEHAKSQPRIDRLKAATIGSPPAILRLILSVIPPAALFLPVATFRTHGITMRYDAISIFTLIKSAGMRSIVDDALKLRITAILLFLLLFSVAFWFLCLVFLPASLGPWGKRRTLVLSLLLLFHTAAAAGLFSFGAARVGEGSRLETGAYLYLGAVLVKVGFDIFLLIKGLPVKYTPCYIGGLPAEEYFRLRETGAPELLIREKMADALTVLQEEFRRKQAAEAAEAADGAAGPAREDGVAAEDDTATEDDTAAARE